VHGQARPFRSAREAIEAFRQEIPGVGDQNLPAFVVTDTEGKPLGPIQDGAAVIFFNFRGDRAIEICRAFEQDDFPFFDRGRRPEVAFAGLMQYDGDYKIPKSFLVAPPTIDRTMGEYLARNAIAQLACSETQKYGHVTYFWNGNRGGMFDESYETYIEVPSDQVPFQQRPWMKAAEITDAVIEALRARSYPFVRLNYANGDMVGHTTFRDATIYAVEAVDLSLGRLLTVVQEMKGIALVTADHGNADEMYERDKAGAIAIDKDTGQPKPRSSHSLNPVPFIVFDPSDSARKLRSDLPAAGLANVAATAFHLLGFEAPEGYEPGLLEE
jgi:2,3-bisphosphoglycerate-independent phosphoglycerate mutase